MRTDIHKPSSINPEEYTFVAFEQLKIESFGMCEMVLRNREIIRQHMATTGGTYSGHEHGGNCMICGAWAVYTVLFYHANTNSYIRTGQDCANKLGMSYGDMNLFRKQVYDHRKAKAGVKKAEATMEEHGLLRVLEIIKEHAAARIAQQAFFNENEHDPSMDAEVYRRGQELNRRWAHAMVIEDIFIKLVKYGSISDAQVNLLRIKVQLHDNYEARQRQFAQEREAAAPCPTGRVEVKGEVLKVAEYDSQFGTQWKMTVKADEGFCIFVSVPSSMPVPNRGDRVAFKATITPSDRDPKFGFGKRPIAA